LEPSPIDISPLLPHVVPWSLVFCRVLGIFIFMPMMTGGSVPMQYRALLAAALAVCAYALPEVRASADVDVGMIELGEMLLREMTVGMAIGAIGGLPFVAIEIAGHIMGYQMGFALAQAYNPELDINLNSIGSMLFLIAITVFAGIGGLEALFVALLDTFATVPVGRVDLTQSPVETLVGVLTAGTEVALSIAMPVMAVVMLMLIAIGFVMKTMPQINVMSVGFALKIVAGTAILAVGIFSIEHAIAEFTEWGVLEAVGWSRAIESLPAPAEVPADLPTDGLRGTP